MTVPANPWLIPGINARLIELHAMSGAEQHSMAGIAGRLSREFNVSITKNAIIGRSHRLLLPPRPQGATVLTRKPEPKKVRKERRRVDAPIAPPIVPRCESTTGLTIYQLREGDCHWPLGPVEARPPYAYCGEYAEIGQPYCLNHYQRGHIAPRKTWS
jgi:hypothetical protein